MPVLQPFRPVDYLAIGHLAVDIGPLEDRLGGSVAYAALTARALGLQVGIVTSMGENAPIDPLEGIQMAVVPSRFSTTFENAKTPNGRKQTLHHQAGMITLGDIPDIWRSSPIVHLAPIAREMDASITEEFGSSLVGVTPQGWLRTWDENGAVTSCDWEHSEPVLQHAAGVVMSVEDVNRDLEKVESIAHRTRVLCLTEGESGCVLYWNGDRRRFRPPAMNEVDATGAGDIFAAAFFVRLRKTRDPWEAARFATHLAAHSVTRHGLNGIPTKEEIDSCLMEVLL